MACNTYLRVSQPDLHQIEASVATFLHGNNLKCSTSCMPCTGCQPSGYVKDLSIELLCSYTTSHGRYLGKSLKLTQFDTIMDCPLLVLLLVT